MFCSAILLHHNFSYHAWINLIYCKSSAHLFSNNVYHGHTLLMKTYMYMYCTVKYPIIGIYPHVKCPYNSADLMAPWSCFLWIIWELGRKLLGNVVCRPFATSSWGSVFTVTCSWWQLSPCSRHDWPWATEWHPRLACECYLIKYFIIDLFLNI